MRSAAYKIASILMLLSGQAFALDLTKYEKTCSEIGFKPKTPAYGECVLELYGRENKASSIPQKQLQTANAQGDGTPDHAACVKHGLQAGTTEYSQCRTQIDSAKREQAQNQARFDAEQRRYEEERQRYEYQLAEYEKEKERSKGLAWMQFGAALANGKSRSFAENFGNAGRQSLGMAPEPPRQPSMQNFTITSPSGIRNCTVWKNNVNCF